MQLCQSWAQLFRILWWLTKQSDDQINMHIDDNEIEDKNNDSEKGIEDELFIRYNMIVRCINLV